MHKHFLHANCLWPKFAKFSCSTLLTQKKKTLAMTVVGWITLYHPSRHDARGVPLKKCIFGPPYPFIMIATRGHWELGIATLVRWDGKHHSLLMTASLLTTRLDWQWLPLFWLQDLTGNDCLWQWPPLFWLQDLTASLLTTKLSRPGSGSLSYTAKPHWTWRKMIIDLGI